MTTTFIWDALAGSLDAESTGGHLAPIALSISRSSRDEEPGRVEQTRPCQLKGEKK